jgi:hypothetical protein
MIAKIYMRFWDKDPEWCFNGKPVTVSVTIRSVPLCKTCTRSEKRCHVWMSARTVALTWGRTNEQGKLTCTWQLATGRIWTKADRGDARTKILFFHTFFLESTPSPSIPTTYASNKLGLHTTTCICLTSERLEKSLSRMRHYLVSLSPPSLSLMYLWKDKRINMPVKSYVCVCT